MLYKRSAAIAAHFLSLLPCPLALYVQDATTARCFLSAAQPKDQGEESVLLLVVVVGGGHFSVSRVQFFWGVKGQKLCQKRGVVKQKLCLKMGVKRQKLWQKYYFPRRRSVKVSLSC